MTSPATVVAAAVRGTTSPALSVDPIDDVDHRPYGVLEVLPLTYGFRIVHEELEALGAATVTADETLARLRITPGASWGTDHVDVTLWRDGARVKLEEMCVPYANVWVHLTGYPGEPS